MNNISELEIACTCNAWSNCQRLDRNGSIVAVALQYSRRPICKTVNCNGLTFRARSCWGHTGLVLPSNWRIPRSLLPKAEAFSFCLNRGTVLRWVRPSPHRLTQVASNLPYWSAN